MKIKNQILLLINKEALDGLKLLVKLSYIFLILNSPIFGKISLNNSGNIF